MAAAYQMDEVDVPGLLAIYQNSQDRRTRQMIAQKEMERADRKEQRERDFDGAFGRYVGSGGLDGAYGSPSTDRSPAAGPSRNPIDFASGGMAGAYGGVGGGAKGLAALFENRPARPAGALTSVRSLAGGGPGAAPERGNLVPIDPDTVGMEAAPMAENAERQGERGPENLLPPAIQRLADSPNMEDRNAAFMEMARIDPKRAFQIQSDAREAALDRLKGGQEALRIAASRLASTNDDNTYRAVLADLDAQLMPLGIDLSQSVPPTHPGPEGIRKLQMLAIKEADQLAAIDREHRTAAYISDIDADNERADRNTDSLIADRSNRTRIARDRAETSAEREARLAAGGGRGGRSGGGAGGSPKTAVNQKTGERLELRGGKWVPAAQGGPTASQSGGFR